MEPLLGWGPPSCCPTPTADFLSLVSPRAGFPGPARPGLCRPAAGCEDGASPPHTALAAGPGAPAGEPPHHRDAPLWTPAPPPPSGRNRHPQPQPCLGEELAVCAREGGRAKLPVRFRWLRRPTAPEPHAYCSGGALTDRPPSLSPSPAPARDPVRPESPRSDPCPDPAAPRVQHREQRGCVCLGQSSPGLPRGGGPTVVSPGVRGHRQGVPTPGSFKKKNIQP